MSWSHSRVEWSHGKGAVDGIGGTVKRSVRQKVLARQAIVSDAQSFYMIAKAAATKIELLYIPESEIVKNKEVLDQRWLHCQTPTGTQSVHQSPHQS